MDSEASLLKRNGAYRESLLPAHIKKIAIEAGVSDSWYRYVGSDGLVIGLDRFGESAPGATVFDYLGFSVDSIIDKVNQVL